MDHYGASTRRYSSDDDDYGHDYSQVRRGERSGHHHHPYPYHHTSAHQHYDDDDDSDFDESEFETRGHGHYHHHHDRNHGHPHGNHGGLSGAGPRIVMSAAEARRRGLLPSNDDNDPFSDDAHPSELVERAYGHGHGHGLLRRAGPIAPPSGRSSGGRPSQSEELRFDTDSSDEEMDGFGYRRANGGAGGGRASALLPPPRAAERSGRANGGGGIGGVDQSLARRRDSRRASVGPSETDRRRRGAFCGGRPSGL